MVLVCSKVLVEEFIRIGAKLINVDFVLGALVNDHPMAKDWQILLLLGLSFASHANYESIDNEFRLDMPSAPQRQLLSVRPYSVMTNSLTASEQVENLGKCQLALGGILICLLFILQAFNKAICPDSSHMFYLMVLAFPLISMMIWESIMASFIVRLIYSLEFQFMDMGDVHRMGLKAANLISMLLVGVKWLGLIIPAPPYTSVLGEVCEWQGDTHFDSSKWILTETIPSLMLVALAGLIVWMNKSVAERNKDE